MLENIVYNYLKSKNYNLSVGKIGKLECNFIARKDLSEFLGSTLPFTHRDAETEKEKEIYPRRPHESVARRPQLRSPDLAFSLVRMILL